MKLILEIANTAQGAQPTLRLEGQAQIGTLLQALEWARTQLLAQVVGQPEEQATATEPSAA